jgi:hypothetical protein
MTVAPTTYELGFSRANTFRKFPGLYFHMHQTSSSHHIGASHNRHFSAEIFTANGVVTPYFGLFCCVPC